jgi:hypothetical protein
MATFNQNESSDARGLHFNFMIRSLEIDLAFVSLSLVSPENEFGVCNHRRDDLMLI